MPSVVTQVESGWWWGGRDHDQGWASRAWGSPEAPSRSLSWRDWPRVISLSLVTKPTWEKMRSPRGSVRREKKAEPRGRVGQGAGFLRETEKRGQKGRRETERVENLSSCSCGPQEEGLIQGARGQCKREVSPPKDCGSHGNPA